MSKTRIFALSMIALMLAAFFTNPKKEQHEEAVKEKAIALLKQEAGQKNKEAVNFGIQLFGQTLLRQFMEEHIQIENYYLFSLTKIHWDHRESAIGFGAFNHVWLSTKIEEKATEIVDLIKGK